MDYDNWLQKSAGCFDDYYEADDNEIFDWYNRYHSEDVTPEMVLYGDWGELDYVPYLIAEAICERMSEDNEFIKAYDSGFVEDLNEYIRKYPERAKILYDKYKPDNLEELRNLLGKDWEKLEEEYSDYINNYDPDDYRDWD